MGATSAYQRTRLAVLATLAELRRAHKAGQVKILPHEVRWLDRLQRQADALPEEEAALVAEMLPTAAEAGFLPEEYGL
jgi:hypothetical protein